MKIRRKKIIITSSVVSVLVVIVTGAILINGKSKSAKLPQELVGAQPEKMREYFRSEDFNGLGPQIKRSYFRQAMRQTITSRAQEYSQLTSKNEKIRYLDNIIDEMEKRRKEFEKEGTNPFGQGRPGGGDATGQRGGGPRGGRQRSPEGMRSRMERVDSTTRAQMAELFQDMRARRQQRGLETR